MIRSSVATMVLALLLAGCGDKPASPEDPGEHARKEHGKGEGHDAGREQGAEAEHEEGPPSTTLTAEVARRSGVQTAPVTAGTIADQHEVQGLLTPVEGRVARAMARFPGPIRSLHANVGDRVRAGQPLAKIESKLSLTTYRVRAPISGVVLQRDAAVGAVASESTPLYEIADLSELWVDLHIFGADAQHITAGSPVVVTRMSDATTAETVLERILPSTATASQSTVARARIQNLDGLWRPGSAVKARVTVAQQPVSLMVPLSAVQTAGETEVVYVKSGGTYTQRPVRLGQRDATRVEVQSGLKTGEQVVTAQSFLIKADIEKSTAEHDH